MREPLIYGIEEIRKLNESGQGGCTGNYCYADEFRWMDKKKNVFHTNISEIEAITGNDSIENALSGSGN